MRLDLADLQLFVCVLEAGSITQGAVRAHLALASASERLRRMEADAGVPLLARHARGVVPTEAGQALAHHARLVLRQQALLQGELHDFAAGARGTLRLYANTAALVDFLPDRLAPWLAARPQLQVELKERTSEEIVRSIAQGWAQGGIVSSRVAPPAGGDEAAVPAGVVQTDAAQANPPLAGVQLLPVANHHLVLIVPPGHALAGGKAVALAQVLATPMVGLTPEHALQTHLDGHAHAAGHAWALRIRMKTLEGVCQMVGHGVGAAIVPLPVARRWQRRHGYRIVKLQALWAQRQLCLCCRDVQALPAPMRSLFAHLGQGAIGAWRAA